VSDSGSAAIAIATPAMAGPSAVPMPRESE
jgi:hypothetical protein